MESKMETGWQAVVNAMAYSSEDRSFCHAGARLAPAGGCARFLFVRARLPRCLHPDLEAITPERDRFEYCHRWWLLDSADAQTVANSLNALG